MEQEIELWDGDEKIIAEGEFISWKYLLCFFVGLLTLLALVMAITFETPGPLLIPAIWLIIAWIVSKIPKPTLMVTNYRVSVVSFWGGMSHDIMLDSVTAVHNSCWGKTLKISTKGGSFSVQGLANSERIREKITDLLMEREAMISFGMCREE